VAASEPLSRIQSTLHRAARDLDDLGRRWALVGGLAVSARTEPRFTRDIDLVVAVEGDRDAERLVHDLQSRGYRVRTIAEQEAVARLATARLVPGGEDDAGVVVDVLFASSGIEAEIVARAEVLAIGPDLRVPVAAIGHLIALKVLSRDDAVRPLDRADLVALVRAAQPSDIEQARAAVALIQRRGFQRDRDLPVELERFLQDSRPPRRPEQK
jgi:predicted nucleotidyltransferase